METIIMQIVVAVISVIATGLSGYAVALLRKSFREKKAEAKGTMILLQARLIDYHEDWTGRGYVTVQGRKTFDDMYQAYKDLGGNGVIDSLKKDIDSLPFKTD